VYDLSAGKTESSFCKLDAFVPIHEVEDNVERLEAIADRHIAAVREGKSSLIVAPTHTECRAISEVVRDIHLYTDSKAALKEAVMRPSERLSPLELLDGTKSERAFVAEMQHARAAAKSNRPHR
jgi:hypothetical protein